MTVDRALELLQEVEDPVLAYEPERGGLSMSEIAGYNRHLWNMFWVHGLIPVLRAEVEPLREKEQDQGYCRACMLLDRFLVEDPDPTIVGV